MYAQLILLSGSFILCSCSVFDKVESRDPEPDDRVSQVEARLSVWQSEVDELTTDPSGWLIATDCDSMIHEGVLRSSYPGGADITASEFEDQPGRFGRRPPPRCWDPELGDQGSKTTWSRDMGLGLITWAYYQGHRDVLERHRDYGAANFWKMGEPLDDGRAVYTPAMYGLVYQAIYAMGGEDHIARSWPNVYSSGLVDYQARLQVLSIAIRGDIAKRIGEPADAPSDDQALTLSISGTMYERLTEHHEREPQNPYYAAVWGRYSGDMGPAIDLCLDPDEPVGSYIRCEDDRRCQLAELIHACSIVVNAFK